MLKDYMPYHYDEPIEFNPIYHDTLRRDENYFQRAVRSGVDSILNDHKVFGKTVVPFAFYFDVLCTGVKNMLAPEYFRIEQFKVYNKVELNYHDAVFRVRFSRISDNHYKLVLQYYYLDVISAIRIATADLHIDQEPVIDLVANHKFDQEEGQVSSINVRSLYAQFSMSGIDYGKRFRRIHRLACGDNYGKGIIKLEHQDTARLSDYIVHPVILDCGFQMLRGLCLNDDNKNCYIPVSVRSMCIIGSLPAEVICKVKVNKQKPGGRMISATLVFYSPGSNDVLLCINNLNLMKVGTTF